MTFSLTLLIFLLPLAIVFGNLLPTNQTTRPPRMAEEPVDRRKGDRQREQRSVGSPQDNPECQQGIPLGATYSGSWSNTASGRTCQVWSTSQPHEHPLTGVGEHNYCRN